MLTEYLQVPYPVRSMLLRLKITGTLPLTKWDPERRGFAEYEIIFTEEEIKSFEKSIASFERYLEAQEDYIDEREILPPDIISRIHSDMERWQVSKSSGCCFASLLEKEVEWLIFNPPASRRRVIERYCAGDMVRRACKVAVDSIRYLSNREKQLSQWEITREDDVRDLFFVILRVAIPDLRSEVPMPSPGRSHTFCDLKSIATGIIIEFKWVRLGQWKKIRGEIHDDIQSYGRDKACRELFFVVVDDGCNIPDLTRAEAELRSVQNIEGNKFSVELFVIRI